MKVVLIILWDAFIKIILFPCKTKAKESVVWQPAGTPFLGAHKPHEWITLRGLGAHYPSWVGCHGSFLCDLPPLFFF